MERTTPLVVVHQAGPKEINFGGCCCQTYTSLEETTVFQCGFCAEQSPTTWCRTEHQDVLNVTFRQASEETITTKDGAEVTCTVSKVVPAPASS